MLKSSPKKHFRDEEREREREKSHPNTLKIVFYVDMTVLRSRGSLEVKGKSSNRKISIARSLVCENMQRRSERASKAVLNYLKY